MINDFIKKPKFKKSSDLHKIFLLFYAFSIILLSVSNATIAKAETFAVINMSDSFSTPPTSKSSLIVLLDRSGSLNGIQGNDPDSYSTSVAKSLADLWPGVMSVIPFSGDFTTLPVLGPAVLAYALQRAHLKEQIQQYPIGGFTPLAPAMHEALQLLKNAAPGSEVVLITDGAPTGLGSNSTASQEQDIKNNLIPQFRAMGIPVNIFGVKIADSDANQLLTTISHGTASIYTDVQSPEELASAIINLYAQWRNLSFERYPINQVQNNFPIYVDPFATFVYIAVFRSQIGYSINLTDPNGQTIPNQDGTFSSDRHYELYELNMSPTRPGIYTVSVGNDPDAQVYALIRSPLAVKIIVPIKTQVGYTNIPMPIKAAFYNGQNLVTPPKLQARMDADITFFVNGNSTISGNDIVLTQEGAFFTGKTLAYNHIGDINIEILASYQQTKREASLRLHIQQQLASNPPCQVCLVMPPVPVIGALFALAILIIMLFYFFIRGAKKERDEERAEWY